jgi:hypothetical protein
MARARIIRIFSVSLHIYRVVLLLLRQRRGAAGSDLDTTIKHLQKQRVAPRASA